MANSINLSNANSALVASLMDAKESVQNVYEYSISEQRPFGALQYEELLCENPSQAQAGQSVTFNVSKIGYLRQAVLQFGLTTSAGASIKSCRIGALKCIDRVEMLSSSRRIAVLDRFALQAALSDMPSSVRDSYRFGMMQSSDGSSISAANETYHAFLALPFAALCGAHNAIATHFTEPLRVRVYWSDLVIGRVGSIADPVTAASDMKVSISDPTLLVKYEVLNNAEDDQVIEANYSDGPLSQLMWDYESETGTTAPLSSTTTTKLSRTLVTNSVVTDLYAIVTCDSESNSADDDASIEYDTPLQLDRISFTGSGQNILPDCKAQFIGFYGRATEAERFLEGGSTNSGNNGDPAQSCWVYKIQLAGDSAKQKQTGGCSMRELNAPTVNVHVSKCATGGNDASLAGKNATLRVVARHHTIVSTDPSSGKMTQLLTN